MIEGHLARMSPTTTAEIQAANRAFRKAPELDAKSVDPHLGLARIHAYNVRDVDALIADIKNAEARGYKPGRRERTQLDDAIRLRTAAARIRGGDESAAGGCESTPPDAFRCVPTRNAPDFNPRAAAVVLHLLS